MRRTATVVAICAAVSAATAAEAPACSCVAVDERTKYRASDAAFVGRLVNVTPPPSPTDSGRPAHFRYELIKRYKRKLGRRFVTVRSGSVGDTCGLPTETGRRYAMYLERVDGRWVSGVCSLTTPARLRNARRAARARASYSPIAAATTSRSASLEPPCTRRKRASA